MKIKLLVTYLLIQTSLLSYSQNKTEKANVLFGEEVKESRLMTLDYIIGDDEKGIYVMKRKVRRRSFAQIEHYDNKMNLVKSEELEIEYQKKELDLEGVIQFDDQLYALASFKNNKLKKNFLFIKEINKKTLKQTGSLKKIAEIDYDGKSRRNAGFFSYSFSPDRKKLLIYYKLPYDKKDFEKIGMHVFDKEIEEVWSNEITIPYSDELFSLQNYKVANTGDVFILGKLYQDKVRESRKGKPNFNYYILSYSYKENELDKIPVVIDGKFLTDMKIGINENNEVICGGFYSDEGTYSIKGSYFLRIDTESKKILSKSFKEFGIDFITQNMSDRQEKKAKKKKAKGKNVELFQYDLSDFVLREDGGVVLVGEQYYVRVSSYTDANGNTRTTYTYYYNDIIVININPKGQIEWAEKIPKRQVSSNDGGFYSSYALMVLEDKLYFVFNDNIKNLVITKNNQRVHNFSRGKNSVVTLVEMDSDGRYVREALFSGDETDIITRPKVCRQISDNEMIVFGQRKKKQRFAKVTFVD